MIRQVSAPESALNLMNDANEKHDFHESVIQQNEFYQSDHFFKLIKYVFKKRILASISRND